MTKSCLWRYLPTLQALLWEFTSLGAAFSTLKSIVDAIIGEHKKARLPSLVGGHFCYNKVKAILQRVLGKPHIHKLGVTRDMVVSLLRLRPPTLLAWRNQLASVTMTMGIMRQIEGALTQSCDYTRTETLTKA